MGRPSRCPEELRREAVELCRSRIVRVVGLGSLGVFDGSPAAWVRARSAAQTRRFEVDGPVRAGPARKENAELRLDRAVPRQPRPPILPGRRSVTRFGVRFGIIKRPVRSSVRASPVGCSRSGLPRWRDRPLSPRHRADGEPRQRSSMSVKGHRGPTAPLCSWPAETSRPGGTAPSGWLGSWPNAAGVGAWAQEPAARQTVEPRRVPTSLAGTSPLMRQISAGSPTSAGFGCVDAKLYRAGILDPTTAPSRAALWGNAGPPVSSSTPWSWPWSNQPGR